MGALSGNAEEVGKWPRLPMVWFSEESKRTPKTRFSFFFFLGGGPVFWLEVLKSFEPYMTDMLDYLGAEEGSSLLLMRAYFTPDEVMPIVLWMKFTGLARMCRLRGALLVGSS